MSKTSQEGGGTRVAGFLAAVASLVVILLLPTPQGLPYAGQVMLGLLLFSVILWMTEAVDYAVSAVLITALMAFLLGLAPNAAKPDAMLGTSAALGLALGGFANTALALVAAATFLSAAMTVTGLDRRIALFVLSKVGARLWIARIMITWGLVSAGMASSRGRPACR